MLYPQCYNGYMKPFVTHEGFLFPCCQLNYSSHNKKMKTIDGNIIINPFIDEDFSLYKKSYAEIIESKKWNDLIDNMNNIRSEKCYNYCSVEVARKTSFTMGYDEKSFYKNQKIYTKDINRIQIETSDRCSLECLYCMRKNIKNKNKTDISLEILKSVFEYKNWHSVIDCGSLGDPIFYKNYHELLQLINQYMIGCYTVSIAATGKTKKWWDITQELWKELNESGIKVVIFWGIDGLEDTSKMHRINQNWNEITTNMKIAAKNGLDSRWQYIPMSFNEHQVNDARKLAKDWGVTFYFKPSYRFGKNDKNMPVNNEHYLNDAAIKNNFYSDVNYTKKII